MQREVNVLIVVSDGRDTGPGAPHDARTFRPVVVVSDNLRHFLDCCNAARHSAKNGVPTVEPAAACACMISAAERLMLQRVPWASTPNVATKQTRKGSSVG